MLHPFTCLLFSLACLASNLAAQEETPAEIPPPAIVASKIEPPNWWVGPPNGKYAFVKVEIPESTKPGKYVLKVTRGDDTEQLDFLILARNRDSKQRQGFRPEDIVYLITPDRFANGDRQTTMLRMTRQICLMSMTRPSPANVTAAICQDSSITSTTGRSPRDDSVT